MRVFTTAKGEFRAELTQVVMNKLWMQRFRENLPRVHKGAIRHGRRVFNFLTEGQPEVYNRGRVMSPGEICADDFNLRGISSGQCLSWNRGVCRGLQSDNQLRV